MVKFRLPGVAPLSVADRLVPGNARVLDVRE